MDEKLIKAIKEMADGKESGFNIVYSETYNHVFFRVKQHMNSDEDAQDLTQIVFVEAFKNIGSLQAPEALYSWLDRITYNQGMKLYRKKKEVLLSEEGEGVFDTLESNDIESMPELSMDQRETSKIIREIIEELPEAQKVTLIAYYFDHFSVGQIAEMEECSEGTIKSRLNYARKYLKDKILEKERREGYKLHAFALPLLWWAIKFMAEDTTMSASAAQSVYNGACAKVGLQAGAITVSNVAAGNMASGMQSLASTSAKNAAGKGAGFAALSGGTKALIIAGTLAITGAGIGGAIYSANTGSKKVVEEAAEEKASETNISAEEKSLPEKEEATNDNKAAEAEGDNNDIETAKTDFTDAEKNQLGIAICYAKNNDFLSSKDNYVFNTRMYIDNVLNGREYEKGLLPLGWSSNVVSEETVKTFWKDGFGIDIPDGYTYFDSPFWGDVSCDSDACWDASLERLTVKELNIADNTDGTYTISGVILYGEIFDESNEGDIEEKFSAICELSGNKEVFGGYRIISFDNNTSEIDFDDIAKKYAEIAAGADPNDVVSAKEHGFNIFYIDDVNSDGIPEFLMPTPYADEATKEYLIYSYKDGSAYQYGAVTGGHVMKLYGFYDSDNLICEWIQSGENGAGIASPAGGSIDFIYTYQYKDTDDIVPKFPGMDGAYEMQAFSDISLDGIKNELKRFQ